VTASSFIVWLSSSPAIQARYRSSKGRSTPARGACTLSFDCLVHDGQGAPYLRYLNHKIRREAAVPIDEELQSEVRAQQTRAAARWTDAHPHPFPALTGNAGGQRAMT